MARKQHKDEPSGTEERLTEAARQAAAAAARPPGTTYGVPAGETPGGVPGTAPPGAPGAAAQGAPAPLEPGQEYVRLADFEKVAAERDEHRADLQRVAAEFENFRKRAAREREQAAAAADAKLLGELLAVIDDMERAAEHLEQAESDHPTLVAGIRMMHQRLDAVLRAHGLQQIEANGTFDPHLHEAMMMQPSEEHEDGTILQTLQSGWKLGDRVLRHARVIVAGGDAS